ncbi:hypothetical protein vseg_001126 [Gypsophila vaccaria]
MAPTPNSATKSNFTLLRTPQSKQKINFNSSKTPQNPNPNQNPNEHPVEVIGRVRNNPDPTADETSLQINPDRNSIRIRTEFGYRDFKFDGVSSSTDDDLERFYDKFIAERIRGVKMGAKCTVMMYGPTGSGKSHTMFGGMRQPGIVYRALRDILGGAGDDEGVGGVVVSMFVQVTVLEIYNEEIYDLLSCDKGGGGFTLWSKGSASKVKLEVMGKKAKNATFISGNEAGKLLKEIQKVEKRRIVKSTNCNDRSSRSHCMIILDVPTVGGRLMLVDMAGSENIEQAGQIGFEAKMQTAKINQGNIALKRVVESIANGDSHVPFRDSKLTMLLQDSFEDDKSKILMILCASPDPKELHKTICTLEYGAKAKCIVRGPHTPKDEKLNGEDSSSAVILGSRVAAMDQFIMKLQMENKQREKECNEARKQLMKKEEEVSQLRSKLDQVGEKVVGASEEEINEKVNERMEMLKRELNKQLEECRKMASEYVEMEKRIMEEKIQRQQQEVEYLRRRLEEMEIELSRSKDGSGSSDGELESTGLARRLKEVYADEDPGMLKSMDIDTGDQESYSREVKIVGQCPTPNLFSVGLNSFTPSISDRTYLSTVFEEEEAEVEDCEVEKKVIEEKKVSTPNLNEFPGSNDDATNVQLTPSSRKTRIQNIFTLCGNYRELSQKTPACPQTDNEPIIQSPIRSESLFSASPEKITEIPEPLKENMNPAKDGDDNGIVMEVYVKWEATKDNHGKFINKLKVVKDATLADLRKLIEIHLGVDKQDFTFLSLGDPTGAPISKEKETVMLASKLPTCNTQLGGHLACLRPVKGGQCPSHLPFTPLENKLPMTPLSSLKKVHDDNLSPCLDSNLGSTPYITVRRC